MILITGMNLAESKSATPKEKSKQTIGEKKLSRNERIKRDEKLQYERNRKQPYNRTFAATAEELDDVAIGRIARKKYRKQARLQSGFMSWTLGLFSGLVVVLILGAFLKESDVDSEWEANATMIIEETPAETQAVEPERVTIEDLGEEDVVIPEFEDETVEESNEDELTIGGEPVDQAE